MPRRDFYHNAFKEALVKDGWTITHDPLTLLSKIEGGLQTDLGAEKSYCRKRLEADCCRDKKFYNAFCFARIYQKYRAISRLQTGNGF